MSTLTNGGLVGGGVLAFLAFAAFWAKSGELRARRQRRKARRMVREREAGDDVAAGEMSIPCLVLGQREQSTESSSTLVCPRVFDWMHGGKSD
jgi:hypothetical protein